MVCKIPIRVASDGASIGTKLLLAARELAVVCRRATAELIPAPATEVCLRAIAGGATVEHIGKLIDAALRCARLSAV